MNNLSRISKLFDKRSFNYSSIYNNENCNSLLNQEKIQRAELSVKWAEQYLKEYANGKILDVGCGFGNFLFHIYDLFPEVKAFGIDISPKMIEKANNHAKESGYYDIRFEVAKLSHNLGEFNIVTSLGVIGYQDNQSDFLRDLAERVLPSGILIFTLGNGDSWVRAIRTALAKIKDLMFRKKTIRFKSMKHSQFHEQLHSMGFVQIREAYLSFGLGFFPSKLECKFSNLVSDYFYNNKVGRYFSLTSLVAYKRIK